MRERRWIPGSWCVLAVLLGGCSDGGAGGTEPTPTNGTIAGQVSEAGTGVEGARIALSGGDTRTTDGSGQFRFDALSPATYTLTLTAPTGFSLGAGETAAKSVAVQAGRTATLNWALERPTGGPPVREIRLTAGQEFSPAALTIPAGTTVRWINEAAMFHTVTPENESQPGVWSRRTTNSTGVVFEHTFTASGQTYRYRCEPHSSGFTSGMVGVIQVE